MLHISRVPAYAAPLLLALLTCCTSAPDRTSARFDRTLESVFAQQDLVGLQATVMKDGRLLYEGVRGVADLDSGTAVTHETKMPIASVMKSITGAVYLRLVEEGVIDPDAPVQRYVPDFPATPDQSMTLSHLVGQMHGIRHYRDEFYPAFFTTRYDDLEEAVDIFASDPLVAEPGERYTYSSYAYTLLGAAMQRASGTPFWDLVERYVLGPASMRSTVSNDVRIPITGRARCYAYYDYSWPFNARTDLIQVPMLDMSYNAAGGNTLSTAGDLARFGTALLNGDILSSDSFDTLRRSQQTDAGDTTGWSHGWFVITNEETSELRINGSNPGSWAHLSVFPEERIVIALATNTWGRGSRESTGLQATVSELYQAALQN